MPGTFDWDDTDSLAILLANNFPDIDPLGAGLAQLRAWVTALDQFGGNPEDANEAQLEDIRMAWHNEYNTRNWDAGQNPAFPFYY